MAPPLHVGVVGQRDHQAFLDAAAAHR